MQTQQQFKLVILGTRHKLKGFLMQTISQLQLLPAVNDNATFYVVLQPKTAGLTNSMLVSTALTFNPSSNTFQLNGVAVGTGSSGGSSTPGSSTPSSLQSVTSVGNTTTLGITTGGLTTSGNITIGTATVNNIKTTTQSTTATTAQTAIDTWSTTTYRTVKYLIQMTQGTNYHVIELLAVQNGSTVYLAQYGEVITNTSLGTFDASISGGIFSLLINPASASSTVINMVRDLITI